MNYQENHTVILTFFMGKLAIDGPKPGRIFRLRGSPSIGAALRFGIGAVSNLAEHWLMGASFSVSVAEDGDFTPKKWI